ncbi:SRPBCC family protein [Gaetbulibacter aestuarii]|uniref:SRPBCC family protein n=1 Tax=Gaetbulibacter aestuarii TaxID=1502358 RepID=A0ABW7MZB6_9FLAO
MPIIELKTVIKAKQAIVFDLARSVDLHRISLLHTREKAIDGKTTGLLELNDSVTWRAKHFGVYLKLRSKITEFDQPHFFVDEMVTGPFKTMRHEHVFITFKQQTIMTEFFYYQAPLGIFGRLANILFLKWYMTRLLINRNQVLKDYAESDKWHSVLK